MFFFGDVFFFVAATKQSFRRNFQTTKITGFGAVPFSFLGFSGCNPTKAHNSNNRWICQQMQQAPKAAKTTRGIFLHSSGFFQDEPVETGGTYDGEVINPTARVDDIITGTRAIRDKTLAKATALSTSDCCAAVQNPCVLNRA